MKILQVWATDGNLHYINPLEIESVTWDSALVFWLKSGRFINVPRGTNVQLVQDLEAQLNEALREVTGGKPK